MEYHGGSSDPHNLRPSPGKEEKKSVAFNVRKHLLKSSRRVLHHAPPTLGAYNEEKKMQLRVQKYLFMIPVVSLCVNGGASISKEAYTFILRRRSYHGRVSGVNVASQADITRTPRRMKVGRGNLTPCFSSSLFLHLHSISSPFIVLTSTCITESLRFFSLMSIYLI